MQSSRFNLLIQGAHNYILFMPAKKTNTMDQEIVFINLSQRAYWLIH